MQNRGFIFGISVFLGVVLSPLVPFGGGGAALLLFGAAGLTAALPQSWVLLAFTLGTARTIQGEEAARDRSVSEVLRAEGAFEIVREEGNGALVRLAGRSLVIAKADSLGLSPGYTVSGLLRIDPVRGLQEPAGFQVEPWARARGIDGRARFLGPLEEKFPTPGVRGAARRFLALCRENIRSRLVGSGGDAGELLVALLLGDRSGLALEDRDAFRRAGLSHVLALSGMHVTLLALGISVCFGLLRIPRLIALAAETLFLLWFTVMTGQLAPVVRACGTTLLARWGSHFERRVNAVDALGWVGGGMLLSNPYLLSDLGFRLSFLATYFLLVFDDPWPQPRAVRSLRARITHWIGAGGASLLLSTSIVLATTPDLCSSMGRQSLLAPVTNITSAIPSFASLGWGAAAAFLPLPAWMVEPWAKSARWANASLLEMCRFAGQLPGSDVSIPALPLSLAILLVGGAWALCTRRIPVAPEWRRGALLLGAVWVVGSVRPINRVTFLDVGQGDSILLEDGADRYLVDGGPPEMVTRVDGSSLALRALERRGRSDLEAVVVTHAHLDHTGGVPAILRLRRTRTLVLGAANGGEGRPRLEGELRALADSCGIPILEHGVDEPIAFPRWRSFQVESAWPGGAAPSSVEENDRSLLVRWDAGIYNAFFTGDLETEGETALTSHRRLDPAWLLKAGHHGGRTSTGDALLDALRPRLVVFSCGAGNPHGHPHEAPVGRVRRRGALLLRTDYLGTIAVTRSGSGVRLRWQRDFPGGREELLEKGPYQRDPEEEGLPGQRGAERLR